MNLRKYVSIGKVNLLEQVSYTFNYAVWAMVIAVVLVVFIHIWRAIYGGQETIEGFTLAQMIWYLAMGETIMFASQTKWIEKIGEDIKTGSVANILTKPVSYILSEFSIVMTNFVVSFFVIGSIAFISAYLLIGPISFNILTLPLIFLTIVFGVITSTFLIFSIGMFAFWFEEVTSIYWIYQKMLFILGGMLVPIDVYPQIFKQIIQYLPFSFITYFPSRLFVRFSWDYFLITIIGQLFWISVFGALCYVIYHFGIKRVNINGG